MKSPSRTIAGASRRVARRRSLSSQRVSRGWRKAPAWGSVAAMPLAPPEPPAIGFCEFLSVDLPQLARRPADGVLGLRALAGLGVHVGQDVLRVGLGRLGRRRSRIADHPRGGGGLAVDLHRLVDGGPHRALLPVL